ncbi:uncharacterized protein LY79DRAFT_131580 [Colletotrichum navitas]|uniref:Uncharacterized protein n=1 Tax=Colletotrichum navitas TaxID=681940 RepID=A0AAD8V7C4_9PEZI|nr:uncharacterized protein LY79DRAFT_131580 [Colletotrichum navitas]KAK1594531.1 hypothetical protein LY79DRAFT_131580 [Colletotrichum navitas]
MPSHLSILITPLFVGSWPLVVNFLFLFRFGRWMARKPAFPCDQHLSRNCHFHCDSHNHNTAILLRPAFSSPPTRSTSVPTSATTGDGSSCQLPSCSAFQRSQTLGGALVSAFHTVSTLSLLLLPVLGRLDLSKHA